MVQTVAGFASSAHVQILADSCRLPGSGKGAFFASSPAASMRLPPPLLVLNLALAALFACFAWLQRNDVDPAVHHRPSALDSALWLAFYLLVAVLFVAVCFRPLPRWLLVVAAAACLVEMVRTGPGLYDNLVGGEAFAMTRASMSAEDPRVELSREFFGAAIALAGVGALAWQNRRPCGGPRP